MSLIEKILEGADVREVLGENKSGVILFDIYFDDTPNEKESDPAFSGVDYNKMLQILYEWKKDEMRDEKQYLGLIRIESRYN